MQIVIEIDNEIYNDIKKYKTIFDEYRDDVAEQILNGTSLPKNHGDLIDRDALLIKHFNDCGQECYCCEYFSYGTGNTRDDKCGIILDAPTIIEEVKADEQ